MADSIIQVNFNHARCAQDLLAQRMLETGAGLAIVAEPCETVNNFCRLLDELEELLGTYPILPALVAGDFNARFHVWGPEGRSNLRGELLCMWAYQLNLNLGNQVGRPTCVQPQGSSVVDLTWGSPAASVRLTDWKVDETESLSDHLYGIFKYGRETAGVRDSCLKRKESRWNSRTVDRDWLAAALVSGEWTRPTGDVRERTLNEWCAWEKGTLRSSNDVAMPRCASVSVGGGISVGGRRTSDGCGLGPPRQGGATFVPGGVKTRSRSPKLLEPEVVSEVVQGLFSDGPQKPIPQDIGGQEGDGVTAEEVRKAASRIPGGKAPSPDGILGLMVFGGGPGLGPYVSASLQGLGPEVVWWRVFVEDMRIRRAVPNLQRRIAIRVCCGYRTVSFHAAMMVVGIISLDHLAPKVAEVYGVLMTGHGCFPAFLHRIGKLAGPGCFHCDGAVDDVEHTLVACRRGSRPVRYCVVRWEECSSRSRG
ncbi:hypothetical protein M0804_006790 [Polistes exclamans]|nr:hypothetical protein M0804_006790 [Polistes exclamans]